LTLRRLLTLSIACSAVAVGACNCDEELYSFPGNLVGLVCSAETGQVLANVPLTVVDADGRSVEVVSDATGLFRAEKLAAGQAELTIHAAEGARSALVEIFPGKDARFDDEACRPPVPPPPAVGDVQGCVCDEAVGAWVSGANVFVVSAAGAVFATGTDAVGCFVLENVAAGAQLLQIQKNAFFASHEIVVIPGQSISVPSPTTCEPPPPPAGSGVIEGRVCAPDGTTWLSDATVYVERDDGTRAQASTDVDGNYRLTGVPSGTQTVIITKGSFTTSLQVEVVADQTTRVPEDQCQLDAPDLKIAVVTGSFDRVQDVLTSIGVDPANVTIYNGAGFGTSWRRDLLEDYVVLSQYDIVFLNCGLDESGFLTPLLSNATAVANIRRFVQEGGSVYASDWAYSVVERAWPDRIDFVGNDNGLGSSKIGRTVDFLQGSIVDPGLALQMGTSTIELHYPLGDWVAVEGVDANVQVYIRADAPLTNNTALGNVPHTVGFNAGAGRVIYTSFHQEPGISPAQERVLQLLMFEL
jgi:hypothetical protein